jgi:hypothetical protein
VALSEEQIKDLIRKSSDNDIQNDLKQRDYTYTQRSEVRFLDGHGALQKTDAARLRIRQQRWVESGGV